MIIVRSRGQQTNRNVEIGKSRDNDMLGHSEFIELTRNCLGDGLCAILEMLVTMAPGRNTTNADANNIIYSVQSERGASRIRKERRNQFVNRQSPAIVKRNRKRRYLVDFASRSGHQGRRNRVPTVGVVEEQRAVEAEVVDSEVV